MSAIRPAISRDVTRQEDNMKDEMMMKMIEYHIAGMSYMPFSPPPHAYGTGQNFQRSAYYIPPRERAE